MVWENHYGLRDILLWIVMMISLSISHLFARHFFSFPFLPRWMGDARAIKDVCDAFWWPNLVIHCFLGCAAVPFPIWRGTCRQIIIGLPPVIDYCVFSFFSLSWQLKCTLVLFVCLIKHGWHTQVYWVWHGSETHSLWVWQSCQTQASGSKKLIFFKSTIRVQKQILSHSSMIFHSYALKLNCKLSFFMQLIL
jgi:hypothetical protein